MPIPRVIRLSLALAACVVVGALARGQAPTVSSPSMEAERLLAAMDWVGAAAAYDQVVRREPGNAQAWFRLGVVRGHAGDDRGAAEAFERAGRLGLAESPKVAWEAALAYARLKEEEPTIDWLSRVVDGGLRSATLAATPEFDFMRDDPSLQALTARATNNDRACSNPEYHTLDFWVGDWVVYDQDRVRAGTNRVVKTPDGCAVIETWTGTLGDGGRSLNFYDARTRRWNQVWIGDTGGVVVQQGVGADDSIQLQGETPRADGSRIMNRLTLAPQEGGRVRQLAETSSDGGRTWETQFDFTYVRVAG